MARHRAVIRAAARTLLLFLVSLLAVVSRLQIPHHHVSTRTNSSPDRSRYTAATPRAEIAIDLGNTNSCVAGYIPGKTEAMFQHCIPSWVAFTDDGAALVGDATKNHAEAHPAAAISGFKRILGLRRNYEDEERVVQRLIDRVPYKIGARNVVRPSIQVKATDGELDVEEVAPMVVAELKKMAEDHFVRLIKAKHGEDISEDRIALRKLSVACERAKKALSSQDHAQVSIESLLTGVDFSESLSRRTFEELNGDLFGKVVALAERVMSEAGLERTKEKIDEIVLVGGSTVIPKIQRLVKDYFGGKKLDVRVKPDEAIAIGTAAHVHSSD